MRKILAAALIFFGLVLLAKSDVQPVVGNPVPNRIRSTIVVLQAEWASQIPPSGRVNAPEALLALYPGQTIALGLLAEGPERDEIFDGVSVEAHFSSRTNREQTLRDLTPATIRPIKAQGADFALAALRAAGISDAERGELDQVTSLVTLAVFVPDWTVPTVDEVTDLEISLKLSGTASPVVLEPLHLKIRPTADWLKEPSPTQEEIGKRLNRYRDGIAPGELLSWLSAVAKGGHLKAPSVHGYFAYAFRSNPAARAAAVAAYPALGPEVRPALLWVLRLGGHDLKQLFPALPKKTLASLNAVEPLSDPSTLPRFEDPVDPQAVRQIGHKMDLCWAAWMATGDEIYLRPLVELLEGASDFPAFKTWQETRGGEAGLNAQVARGLAYQIAGWSLGSFQRTDPHVADWLIHWQNDPATSPTVRREIESLPTNPAFRRNKPKPE